jgi:hypothetical protein
MSKKSKSHQKLYKMKGCMKKNKKSRKHLVGGTNLAYTGQPIKTQPNPFLAYTGKGGKSSDNISLPLSYDIMNPNIKLPSNPYGANPALPNTGPEYISKSTIPTNLGSKMYGGGCGTCSNVMTGGTCGTCSNVMTGGGCGTCSNVMTGGGCGCGAVLPQKGGKTIDPQGLVGKPWGVNPAKWPGVDGIDGNRNYFSMNGYKVDPLTALINVGPNPPFLYGGKKSLKGKNKSLKGGKNKNRKTRKLKGGALSNLLAQDFVNLGRQIQYNVGSAYNALNGYAAPTPVLPWQGQLPRTPNLNTIRGAAL